VVGLVEGKVALVTGAGSGIGRASARALAGEGAKVVVADINDEGGRETVDLIERDGGAAMYVRADVAREPEVASLIRSAIEAYGRLDCAHNNAGSARQISSTRA
jgi:NAD(P)-dependent dehydrogenase (short-subunit alcohol dehydrogenase family)